MPTYTSHYGFSKLNNGDHISDDGFKFSDADRDLMDLLIFLAAEGHHHTGGAGSDVTPVSGPLVTLITTSGAIPAGKRVFYRYTLISPSGVESAPSPEVFIDTPAQVVAPARPTLSYETTGGTLLPGDYYYVLSAYVGVNNAETPAVNPEYISVAPTTATNTITVTLPVLPIGADGFNIYRQAPNGPGYFYVGSVDMTVATPPTTFVDAGAAPNCDRTRPTVNTTVQTNSVTVALTDTLDTGWQWRVYRTMIVGDYTNSLLVTSPTPVITDVGGPTTFGQPPVQSVSVGTPAKVQLTDAAEVQGKLPLSSVSAFPQVVTFAQAGDLAPIAGTSVWVCEFPQATIVGVRASLGRGYAPAADDLIVDVNVGAGATPTMTSIFADSADQPIVPVGLQIGARVAPTADAELVEGDVLTIDIDQVGGGATPTDRDLVVNIYLLAYGWTSTLSHVGV